MTSIPPAELGSPSPPGPSGCPGSAARSLWTAAGRSSSGCLWCWHRRWRTAEWRDPGSWRRETWRRVTAAELYKLSTALFPSLVLSDSSVYLWFYNPLITENNQFVVALLYCISLYSVPSLNRCLPFTVLMFRGFLVTFCLFFLLFLFF